MSKITYEERKPVYIDAITLYGPDKQIVVAIEELSELAKELCKALRGKVRTGAICEEIADVAIMVEQLQIIFSTGEGVENQMAAKVQRLKARLIEDFGVQE